MKVFSDAANVSPLQTWLREGPGESVPSHAADGAASAAVATQAPASLHDPAEGLLALDVWKGASSGMRVLATASSAARGDARDCAEYVIEPLLR